MQVRREDIDEDEEKDRRDVRERRPGLPMGVKQVGAHADRREDDHERGGKRHLQAASPSRRHITKAATRKAKLVTALIGSDQ
jgi:hypothetical protein